jgi:outer membrane protein OmpA-like peptidoglycan-associated protein
VASNIITVNIFYKITLYTVILIGVSFLTYAQDTADKPKEIPIKLPNINEEGSTEFSPTISADGKTLIFESDRGDDGKWQLYQSTMDDNGVWSKPEAIDIINNACSFIAGPNLSYDGNTLYYTAFIEGESQTEDIYYSTKDGRYWSRPKKLEGVINTDEAYEGFSSISSDERQMYFMGVNVDYPKDKKAKEDCFEIYVSKKSIKGRWQDPELLPPHINTGCVRDPKIMADNRTLLFSALTIGEKEKFNLFQTQLQLDGSWSDPVPLIYVNSGLNNLAPTIPASGKTMYFNSEGDLYTVGIPPEYRQFFNASIVGYVRDFKNGRGMNAEITVRDANNLEVISIMKANKSGRFNLVLNAGRNYKLEFKKDGFLTQYFDYNLYYLDDYLEEFKTVKLRSDADVGIIVYDKGLDKAMPAEVSILNEDGSLASSISIKDYESKMEQIQLDINKKYSAVASAENFFSDTLAINTSSTTNLQLKFYLEPKTLDYTFNVKDVSSKRKLRSKLTLKNENKDEIFESYGGGTFKLRQGDQYEVLTSGDRGYLLASGKISVPVVAEGEDPPVIEEQSIEVSPITLGANLILNNISFATNSANLAPGSLLELDRVGEFMALNPTVKIEISAHSDDVGAAAFNQQLSQRRAQSVQDYLKKKNVKEANMESIGYGEERPLVPNDSEENRAKNRRVELQIIAL